MSDDDDEGLIDLNAKKVLGLEDTINFGKHKGKTVEDLLNKHPDYLLWAQDAIEWLEIDEDILEAASEKVEKRRSSRGRSDHHIFDRDDEFDDDDDEIPF
jgi:hypothetical protein